MTRTRARLEKLERWTPADDGERIVVFRDGRGAFDSAILFAPTGRRELTEVEADAYLVAHPSPVKAIRMTWGDADT